MAGHAGRKNRLHPSGFRDRLDNMNKDIKKKWVDALRSGKYVQGYDTLKNNSGEYCCLGVLCDLAAKEGVVQEKLLTYGAGSKYYYDGEGSVLPDSVMDWASLEDIIVRVEYEDAPVSLDDLNDSHRLTFNQIADLIEEQL